MYKDKEKKKSNLANRSIIINKILSDLKIYKTNENIPVIINNLNVNTTQPKDRKIIHG